jgi:hypothetical protein
MSMSSADSLSTNSRSLRKILGLKLGGYGGSIVGEAGYPTDAKGGLDGGKGKARP